MRKKSVVQKLFLLLFLPLFLSGCFAEREEGSFSYREGEALQKKDASSLTYHDFFYQTSGGGLDSLPGSGNLRVLVLPIQFIDYSFSEKQIADLDIVFNGVVNAQKNDTGYWQSLQSFYQASSFGKLTITASIAQPYATGMTAEAFMGVNPAHGLRSTDVMRDALSTYKLNTGDDCRGFDQDGNGFIDAVYLIYAAPDYQKSDYAKLTNDQKEKFWAYTSWDSRAASSAVSPVGNSYSWISDDFFYRGIGSGAGVDAHTLIHETGHLLGLDDYYSYAPRDDAYTNLDYKYYDPTGGLDMMDCNVLDHDMWSKYALGWAKPYVLDKTAAYPVTLELAESQTSGDFLLICGDSTAFNGTAFGEYMMAELFTPDGLNSLDSAARYAGIYPRGFFIPGVKISHVDSRLAHFQSGSIDNYQVDVSNHGFLTASSGGSSFYRVGASNTPSKSTKDGYRLIHLMEANGVNTFANRSYETARGTFYANNGTLFQPETDRHQFDMASFHDFFENAVSSSSTSGAAVSTALFNDFESFSYTISVNGIKKVDSQYKVSITVDKI